MAKIGGTIGEDKRQIICCLGDCEPSEFCYGFS